MTIDPRADTEPVRVVARYRIEGAPRTKKNHTRIIRVRGVPKIIQGEANEKWANDAALQLQAQRRLQPMLPTDALLSLRAEIYRDADRGDLVNYLQAICDALQDAKVVANDKLIAAFDGCRLRLDRRRPRVEIELSVLGE